MKLDLVATVFSLFFNCCNFNISTVAKNDFNSSISYFYPVGYFQSDKTPYFEILDFEVKNIGQEVENTFELTYRALKLNYTYYLMYGYSISDGDIIVGGDNFYQPFKKYEGINRTVSFTVNREYFETPFETFMINIQCYTTKNNIPTLYSDQTIDFILTNHGNVLSTKNKIVKLPYHFSYNASSFTGTIEYDTIIFENYNPHLIDQLYFRIKPSTFLFSTGGLNILNGGKFIINNNNGSFDSTIIKHKDGDYYELFSKTKDNFSILEFNSIENGGPYNLYLDSISGLMDKNKNDTFNIKVDNFYLPLEAALRYEKLDCSIAINYFGHTLTTIIWDFDISFSKGIEDLYYVEEEFGKVIDDIESDEVLIPWV